VPKIRPILLACPYISKFLNDFHSTYNTTKYRMLPIEPWARSQSDKKLHYSLKVISKQTKQCRPGMHWFLDPSSASTSFEIE